VASRSSQRMHQLLPRCRDSGTTISYLLRRKRRNCCIIRNNNSNCSSSSSTRWPPLHLLLLLPARPPRRCRRYLRSNSPQRCLRRLRPSLYARTARVSLAPLRTVARHLRLPWRHHWRSYRPHLPPRPSPSRHCTGRVAACPPHPHVPAEASRRHKHRLRVLPPSRRLSVRRQTRTVRSRRRRLRFRGSHT
jgi:hypothetical protein